MSRFDPFARGRESPPAARLTRRALAAAFPMALIPGTTAAGRNQATPAATPMASPSAMGPSLHVEPTTVRFDERFDVWLTGLEPGEEVTVASSFENYGIGLSAEATFAADQDGVVDLASREPLDGTWRVPDTMGLIWSARRSGRYLPHMVGTERITITASIADEVIGEKAIERSILPEDRGPEYIFGDDMVADWFPPAADATRPLPAVIVLGGSDGGLSPYSSVIAALLASRGYAALSLAYFGIGELPPSLTEIPLEYFGTAIHWLQEQPGVDSDRIGVVGVSRGGELALLLGAHYPELTAVVSYVGSGYVHAEWNGPGTDVSVSAWTWRSEPVPHLDRPDMTERELREVEIPVERINGPVLLIGADADLVWPSSYLSNVAWARLQREGHDWPDQFVRYPGAGHGISRPPYQPVTSRYVRALGGDAHSNAIAMANAWPAVCHLLDTRLVFDG